MGALFRASGAVFRLVQLRPHPQEPSDESGDGGGHHGSALGDEGYC